MLLFVLACIVPSFLISLCVTGAMRSIAPRIGLVDLPAARKVHKTPTPLGGGIGIVCGVVVPLACAELVAKVLVDNESLRRQFLGEVSLSPAGVLEHRYQLWWILGGGLILSVMGLIDDRKNLHWLPRLGVQIGIACALVFGAGVHATLFVPESLAILPKLLSVLWILVLVNSFNFLDNMDGLSSGIALIAAVVFATVMLSLTGQPRWLVAGLMLVLIGSLTGFLCHNWHPARIFMGDTGSYFIGLLMACGTLLGTYYEYSGAPGSQHVLLAPFCILAVPLYDFCSVIVIRTFQGRSPFHADKSHFSHRLVELGLRPRDAVLTIHLATLTTGLAALLLYRVSDWSGAFLVVALVICTLAIIAILETVGRRQNGNGNH
ncbi:MAG TPA: MraY family glycosyltransferase [Planctomycetaceae bacterium]|jgi:UDP-GlcNAc:undecaprenyl-phosphate GlcNAc-1-phosphate transferase|nr:MraY family glycosyltransferase [Planctomycetaceae bacterium]